MGPVAQRLPDCSPYGHRSRRTISVGFSNPEPNCGSDVTVPVKAGAHTVTFYAEYITPVVSYDETTLSAEFIPFDGNGHSPTNKAIHAALGDPAFTAKTDAAALNH